MSAYIKSLIEGSAARAQAQRAEQEQAEAQAARERLVPLGERLARLLAAIPIEVQREGLSLTTLQASLRGRWRGHCHPGELGAALRKLGFKRRRRWRGGQGFRAFWHTPTQARIIATWQGRHERSYLTSPRISRRRLAREMTVKRPKSTSRSAWEMKEMRSG